MKKTKQNKFNFELAPKDVRITLRISSDLLKAIKGRANMYGVDYQKVIRLAIEQFLKSEK